MNKQNKQNQQIQQFYNEEFGKLEILTINGEPYFPATECAKILGYKNPRDAIGKHCVLDGVAKRDGVSRTTNQHGTVTEQVVEKTYINEGNLYRLIIRSKLPSAQRFERWVFDEVLPTIRKFGAYATSDTLDRLLHDPKFAVVLINQLAEEREKNEALTEQLEEAEPKVDYYDKVLICDSLYPVSIIAKEYGMTAAAFNRLLHDLGVQFKMCGTWLLYQKYENNGYTKTRTYRVGTRVAQIHTCWTQKGRQFLYDFLKWYNILPVLECLKELYGDGFVNAEVVYE